MYSVISIANFISFIVMKKDKEGIHNKTLSLKTLDELVLNLSIVHLPTLLWCSKNSFITT